MTDKGRISFNIFIVVLSIICLVFLTATAFSYYQVDKKYTIILAFFMFIALSFTTVGIYTGLRSNTEETRLKILNRIGLIGNLLIFLFTVGLMAFAAFSK